MSRDLSYLAKLPVTRLVQGVAVGANSGRGGGLLAKFALAPGWTDAVAFSDEAAAKFYDLLLHVEAKGRLPPLAEEADEALRQAIPPLHAFEWAALADPSRRVREINLVSTPEGLGVEFLVETGEPRAFWFPSPVARFLAEYFGDYREVVSERRAAA